MQSDQLELQLRMPWAGVSPRYLTRGFQEFSLASEGTGRVNLDEIQVTQLEVLFDAYKEKSS